MGQTSDIGAWLQDLGLGDYGPLFVNQALTLELVPRLTDEHLKELGLPLGHRLILLAAAKDMRPGLAESQPAPADEPERRQVAVLFADLVGYSELSNRHDSEEIGALLERFFAHADTIVERFGGHVDKHIGDCVMAVFGAPVSHGNDVERAVGAALAIRDGMESVSADGGPRVDVHVGVASGEVVASVVGGAYTVTGSSVNLASRLTDSARAGQIIVSEMVQERVTGHFACEFAGAVNVKGFPSAVRTWLLTGPGTATASHAPFVGRTRELRQLRAALEACRDSGRGETIVVRGDAGIGKSRLVGEFSRLAAGLGVASRTSAVLDFGTGVGTDAIGNLVLGCLALATASDATSPGDTAAASVASGIVTADQRIFLDDLLGLKQQEGARVLRQAMDPATRERGQREVLGRVAAAACSVGPLLLALEDLHWADERTLGHMAELARLSADLPLLLVMTTRQEGDPIEAAWRLRARGAPVVTIDLGPLRMEEARTLALRAIGAGLSMVENCLERAAGNPLFLEHLLRHVAEGVDSGVPDTVQSLVQARLDRLDALEKAVLQAGAVLGQRFDRDALAHVVGREGYDLGRLVSRLLLRDDGSELQFAHALVRDATYNGMVKSQRRMLHGRAAAWFATRDPLLHAEHLDRAEDTAAPTAYLDAARMLAGDHRYAAARPLVERALELVPPAELNIELLLLRAELLMSLSLVEPGHDAFAAALEAARSPAQRCAALLGLADTKRILDDLDGAQRHVDDAVALAGTAGLVVEAARAHFLRGNLCFPRADIAGCLREHGRSLELARQAGAPELEAAALGGLGDAEYIRGRLRSSHDNFSACVALARRHGLVRTEVANWPMFAIGRSSVDGLEAGLQEAEAAIEAAARIGHQRAEAVGHHSAYFCLHGMLRLDEARRHTDIALDLARHLKSTRFEAEGLAFRAELHRLAGLDDDARADAHAALAICRDTGMAYIGPLVLAIEALASDDPELRRRDLAEGEALLIAGSACHNHLMFRRDAIEIALREGDSSAVLHHAQALDDYARAEPVPWTDLVIARARAAATWVAGRQDSTQRAALQRLQRRCEKFGLRYLSGPIEALLEA